MMELYSPLANIILIKMQWGIYCVIFPEIKQILEPVSTRVISDEHVADLVQQIALHSSVSTSPLNLLSLSVFAKKVARVK